MKTLAIISSQAFSLVNFRGPLIRDLVGKGIRLYALAPDFDDELRAKVKALGGCPIDFQLTRAGMNPWRDTFDALRLAGLLRRLRPDVTLGYFIKPVIYGTLAAWVARIPRRIAMIEGLGYVYTQTSETLSMKRKILRFVVSLMYKYALSKAQKVIFLNDDDISEFTKSKIVSAEITEKVSGIGVDLHEWVFAPPVFKPCTFLLAARLLREKGVVEYVQAARQIKTEFPDVRFILLGDLDQNPGSLTQQEVETWVKDELIEWHGHVNVQPWMFQTSVYVLPSYREGVPRSTQEALATGRAVITTDVPGCRETVINGVNGFLIPARNPKALADAMLKFITNPSLIEQMGKESRQIAESRFDVNNINKHMMWILGVE